LQLTCDRSEVLGIKSIVVQSHSTGDYPPWWKTLRVVIHAVPHAPQLVGEVPGVELPHTYDAATQTLVVPLPRAATDFHIAVAW
jgi:hypothetical protein